MDLSGLEMKTDEWFGFQRHIFDFEGREAWIVEPKTAAEGNPWTWCLEWPTAFVKRTGIPDLLAKGFHHVHLHAEGFGNDRDQAAFRKFQTFLTKRGLADRAGLAGLSFGGLYALRYAAANPECVAAIYLDAPVCSFVNFRHFDLVKEPYGITAAEEVGNDPRLPVNLTEKLTGIPMLLLYGAEDLTVPPKDNAELFAERLRKAGGNIEVVKRNLWGHHPHGLDDTEKIVSFMTAHCP